MVKSICKDPVFLSRKSAPAALSDLPVAQDLRDRLAAHRDGCVGMAVNRIGGPKAIRMALNKGEGDRIRVVIEPKEGD